MACNSIFIIYIFLHFSYDPSMNTFPTKYTCIKRESSSWTNFTPIWFVWSTEAICVFHYSNRIILTKLVHKNRPSILFCRLKYCNAHQCRRQLATHRTRLCLGLGVTHVDKYGLAFLGSTGVPIYKGTFWIKMEVWKTINVMGNNIIWL